MNIRLHGHNTLIHGNKTFEYYKAANGHVMMIYRKTGTKVNTIKRRQTYRLVSNDKDGWKFLEGLNIYRNPRHSTIREIACGKVFKIQ